MNTPNPLVPQGSLLEQQTKSKTKSNLFIAVFLILAIHVVLFGGLLVQGCRQQKPILPPEPTNTPPPAPDTNIVTTPAAPEAPAGYYTETPTNPAQSTTSGPAFSTPPATIPTIPTADAGATVGGTQNYTVVKNDTFGKIAKDHGTTIAALAKANPTANSTKLRIGQVLQLPAASETTVAADAASKSPNTDSTTPAMTSYTVKAGDNLTRVAKTHATTVVAIRKANHLKTDQLHVGQKLKIPAPKSPKTAEPASTAVPVSSEPAMPAPAPAPSGPAGPGRL